MGEDRRGRPRSAALHQAILQATRDLLAESGYAAVSVDRVAARAGVAKQTVYRRWPSKAPLVAEAVLDGAAVATSPPDTGDITQDLRGWLHEVASYQADTRNAAQIRALAAAAAEDGDDAAALYEQLTGPWREALITRLRAAAQAGQLRPGTDLAAAADTLTGALIFPVLARVSPALSIPRASAVLDIVMHGLRAPSPLRLPGPGPGLVAQPGAPAVVTVRRAPASTFSCWPVT
jgi:AcrR family transcriptional regulator